MKRAISLAAVVAALVLAAPAAANYYISQKTAEHYTRSYFHNDVGYHYTAAGCRPQGAKEAQPGYIYHRWVCGFAVGDSRYAPSCRGQVLIIGSRSSSSSYYLRHEWSEGKCPYGV